MNVIIYGTPTCSYCSAAKALCEEKGMGYTYVDLFEDADAMTTVVDLIGPFKTVPQIFVDTEYVGGFTEFQSFVNS